jgi:nicotinic acid phosphoribosyltransferase
MSCSLTFFFTTGLSAVTLTHAEKEWLQSTCSYFTPEYLSYLSQYRFKPDQVLIKFEPSQHDPTRGMLDMEVVGSWVETILWEVPLMSLLSEAYFSTDHCDWSYEGQEGASQRYFVHRCARLREKGWHTRREGLSSNREFRSPSLAREGDVLVTLKISSSAG